jgi:YggT family protein
VIAEALVFLVSTIVGLFSLALLLRFYLQLARAPARNPISHFVVALTDPIVRPARRIIPGWGGIDLSTLVLAWLSEFLLLVLVRVIEMAFLGAGSMPVVTFLVLAALSIVRMSVYLLIGALIVQAVLSWVAPHSPVAPLVNGLVRPFLRPFQRWNLNIGGVDLSPLVLIIVLQLILMIPVRWLEGMVRYVLGG